MSKREIPELNSEALRALKRIKPQDIEIYLIALCTHNSIGNHQIHVDIHAATIRLLASRATFEQRQRVISQCFMHVNNLSTTEQLSDDKLLIKKYSNIVIAALAQATDENYVALGLREPPQKNCKNRRDQKVHLETGRADNFRWIKAFLTRQGTN